MLRLTLVALALLVGIAQAQQSPRSEPLSLSSDGVCIFTIDRRTKVINQECNGLIASLNKDERRALQEGRASYCRIEKQGTLRTRRCF